MQQKRTCSIKKKKPDYISFCLTEHSFSFAFASLVDYGMPSWAVRWLQHKFLQTYTNHHATETQSDREASSLQYSFPICDYGNIDEAGSSRLRLPRQIVNRPDTQAVFINVTQ